MPWGNPVEVQIWLRIKLSVAAYAYERKNTQIMADGDFDALAIQLDPSIATGNKQMDAFFRNKFDPSTGTWIHRHPELQKIDRLFRSYYT